VDFADHGVTRHISEFRGDLAGRKPGLPEFFELLNAVLGPGQYRHRTFPFVSRWSFLARRCDAKSLKIPCGQNPLALAGREKRAWTYTQNNENLKDQACRTRCRTRQPERYNMA
jgi:hypothetical protein